jgi:hypothetical protein
MVKLPPQSFPYGKYDGLTIPALIQTAKKEQYLEWLRTQNIIGYIKGIELEIRPRTDTYGVLIEEEETGYETWAHVPDDIFEAFLKEMEK